MYVHICIYVCMCVCVCMRACAGVRTHAHVHTNSTSLTRRQVCGYTRAGRSVVFAARSTNLEHTPRPVGVPQEVEVGVCGLHRHLQHLSLMYNKKYYQLFFFTHT